MKVSAQSQCFEDKQIAEPIIRILTFHLIRVTGENRQNLVPMIFEALNIHNSYLVLIIVSTLVRGAGKSDALLAAFLVLCL